ncbi:hypothetical protein AAFF_G00412160 [Aldrovandia affinis]|uniref:Uncharacterized protein n=1 Tax=Aldrovandia affinis TaxID=143900 RepID=A0AAD7SBF6_9TELE|nr:hypothetical protein AAFF_G00412160 [Aldrovandia affinis]
MELKVKSMLDLRQLESFAMPASPSRAPPPAFPFKEEALGSSTTSLQPIRAAESEERSQQVPPRPHSIWLSPGTPDTNGEVLYPSGGGDRVSLAGSEYLVKERPHGPFGKCYHGNECHDKQSPDSACSVEYSSSRLSSPDRPREDSEATEPLSVDGNSSDLEGEELEEELEEEGVERGMANGVVPQTPDQEAFLKQHFGTLADLDSSASPSRSQSNAESISARFLSQNCTSRSPFPFPSQSGGGARPLVSEVRPLMEQGQRKGSEDGPEEPDPHEKRPVLRSSPQKKKAPPAADPPRVVSPTSRGVTFHRGVDGLRKSQSVQNLSVAADGPKTPTRPSKEVHPQPSERDPRATPRRTLPAVPTSPQPRDTASTMPKALRSRSYMSPTTSSMAKMSRSVSMGDSLNLGESSDGRLSPSSSSTESGSRRGSGCDASAFKGSSGDKGKAAAPPLAAVSASGTTSPSVSTTPREAAPPKAAVCSSSSVAPSVSTMPRAAAPPKAAVCSSSSVAPSVSTTPRAAVTPTLSAGSPCAPIPKGLQAKLANRPRPHLTLDIPKPLPDRPSMAPCGNTSKASKDDSSPRSPARSFPGKLALPLQSPSQMLTGNVQLVTALSAADEGPGVGEWSLSDGAGAPSRPEQLQPVGEGGEEEELSVLAPPLLAPSSPIRLLAPSGTQDPDASLSVEVCHQVASELQSCMKRATRLYRMVSGAEREPSAELREMAQVLSAAFVDVRADLDSLPPSVLTGGTRGTLCVPGCSEGGPGEERTLALLEQYSELLLKAVEKRLDNKF